MRMSKTTPQQYGMYLNELQQNPYFRENKIKPDHPEAVKTAWANLVTKLNACGGPMKDIAGWKKVDIFLYYNDV